MKDKKIGEDKRFGQDITPIQTGAFSVGRGVLSVVSTFWILSDLKDPRLCPYFNLSLTFMSALFSCLLHQFLKNEEDTFYVNTFSKWKVSSKIRRFFIRNLFVLHLFPILCNVFFIGENAFTKFLIKKTSPYNLQQVTFLKEEDVGDFFFDAVSRNRYLTAEEEKQILGLIPYFCENPFLNYEESYLDLATLKLYYEENNLSTRNEHISASYFSNVNAVCFYRPKTFKKYFPHEVMHAMGSFKVRFMNEGFPSIIVSEYVDDGSLIDGYGTEIFLTEIMIELAGSETLLESYSKEDDMIFMEFLAEKVGLEETIQLLESFEEYSQVQRKYQKNQATVQETKDSFFKTATVLIDYVEQMDISRERKAYVYSCFVESYDYPDSLFKFCYNEAKDCPSSLIQVDLEMAEYFPDMIQCILEIPKEDKRFIKSF